MSPLIRIELERPDGVYYAGEVVRGTVTIQAPRQRCRGAFLSFKGFAHVHWHTGSGDNRSDYDGNTTFQEQRHTLYGNYFRTGLLDEAGENACFDRVADSGVLYIPCDLSEEKNWILIVRVNDYDWGKRDDLLGEILLDVPQLVNSGVKETFQMMRNGRNVDSFITLSAKFLPYEAVFPTRSRSGVNVSVVVKKPLCLVLRIHQAVGLRRGDYFGKNDVYVQVYRPPDGNADITKALPKPDKTIEIPNEELIMPFAFQILADAPGSAEFPGVGDQCHIRYCLRAYIDTANWRDPSVKRILQVIPNRPLPQLALLAPARIEALDQPIYDCSYCGLRCCKLSGLISTKLHLERLAYAPGESVRLGGEVTNDSNKTLPFSIVLTVCVLMRTSRGTQTRGDRFFTLFQSTVPAQSSICLKDLPGIDQIRIPTVFPSFYGGMPSPYTAAAYPCVKWSYTFQVSIGGSINSCCGMTEVHARVPVLICSAAPYSHQIEAASGMPPVEATDPFHFLETYAVTDLREIDTAPTVTGPEDGGVTIAAEHTGTVNAYNANEDTDNVDGSLLNYEPMVHTFSAASPYVPAAFTDAAGSTHDAIMDELLKEMDDSFDKQRTVGQWVRKYPAQAQNLSPNDLTRILDEVNFSLDKDAVVGELVVAFQGTGKLTCAHVVATMKSCSFQKADVAKLMVPHVKDPENKEVVLEQIDFLFEREEVLSRFL
ncbi:hypothetical protein FisN_19Lh034 [Fistulifera solaris]|uniref:Arrestin C-terminal-like domain-containing protein n=1 Tax=Fistulifera solaris TaxID=1519565 RepID=A0A1Z5JR21_FISSO|nr:hypothetical protein FisN_19Lh034 [Fistulifera solaris]|eukprot:GAX16457.1 hypothetical protein FisN_19Lh034 [Fistulifera solaris]